VFSLFLASCFSFFPFSFCKIRNERAYAALREENKTGGVCACACVCVVGLKGLKGEGGGIKERKKLNKNKVKWVG
jgi:hypothetical protein